MRIFKSAWQSIWHNRLRSFLAGFGIAWGLFLLVIFLGIGSGFKEGVMKMFEGFSQKSLFVYVGRKDNLFNRDVIEDILNRYNVITACSPEISIPSISVAAKGETAVATVSGVGVGYFRIRIQTAREGRMFSLLDERRARNVALIGEGISQTLFGSKSGIGEKITLGGCIFNVVGVLSSDNLFSMQERNTIFIPITSYNACFNTAGSIPSFCLSLSSEADATAIEKDLKGYLAYHCSFDTDDDQAVYIANIEAQAASFNDLFRGLEILIWIVGICLLLSGIVGVCNVMLIIVKERTNEIGIRKAVGATSLSVITMVLAESVTITALSGIAGSALGAIVLLVADKWILPLLNLDMMGNLSINGGAVLVALVILCIAGVAAGLFPAIRASQIAPVDAIRYENRE